MKTESQVNNSSKDSKVSLSIIESMPLGKKNQLIEIIRKRFGIRIASGIFVCEDSTCGISGYPDAYFFRERVILPEIVLNSMVSINQFSDTSILSLTDIYKHTNSGDYAYCHPVNANKKEGEKIKRLIPVILIHYKRKAFFFRLDNEIIQELFKDAEMILKCENGIDENNFTLKRFLKHKEYLNYCYAPIKSKLSLELWMDINTEKTIAGKGNLLHWEYLEWKRAEMDLVDENNRNENKNLTV